MNKLFRQLPLPAKLMLIAVIPMALLVYFAIQIYREKSEKISVLENYLQRIGLSANISSLVDDLQTERRFSFGYIINHEWRSELVIQRPKTDASVQRLTVADQVQQITKYTFLDSLAAIRTRVDKNTISPMAVMNYYTNAIFRLNTLNVVSAGNISYLEPVRADLTGQKLLTEMVTYLGIIRSNVYYALYSEQSSAQTSEGLRSVFDIYKSFEQEFRIKASPAAVKTLDSIQQRTDLRATNQYLTKLLSQAQFDSSFTAEEWWQVSANGVDALRQSQRHLLQHSNEGVQAIYDKEKVQRDRSLLFLVLSIAAVISIVLFTIGSISRALNELNKAAVKLSEGATGIPVTVDSNDVIGSLAGSINRIDKNNQALALAAEAIGSGNFEVEVKPRSQEDSLGNAVLRMKEDLLQYNQENEEKLWIHSGVEQVNASLQGEKNLKELAEVVLHATVSYIGGQVGALYVVQERHLELAGGYALAQDTDIPRQVNMGETLVGQAAQQKKLMHIRNVPENFLPITSGTGMGTPSNLLLIPFIHNNALEGIAEIGGFTEFQPRTLAFLNQVSGSIAIALQTAKSRARLQELFEQTQAQAEELQAQHSELENINAELEAQSEKLQASEEELRVQQEELQQSNQEMEERSRLLEERNQLIVEQNMEIRQKAEELAQSTRYKSEFLANMSHELRTPLNSVLLLSRLLSENTEKNLTSDQVEYARVIQSSGQGLLALIDEILDLSKIEAGKMELDYQPVLLQEIANDMKALFAPVAREKRLDFTIQLGAELPSQIETDKLRLEQVLRNLLSNALKFTAQGAVELLVAPDKEKEGYVCFTVKDTGIGIPEDKQALIFEAFQQADGSTRRKYGGTGLGLSISRELSRLLGGELKVTSTPGQGSRFTIQIPLNRSMVQEVPPSSDTTELELPPAPPPPPMTKSLRSEKIPEALPDDRNQIGRQDKTILIIEDDTAFAKALLDFTHKKGYKGLVAVRGDEGIALAQQHKPLGILLDIQLPVKDGWEVMEELKANPATRHIPVHIMSSLEVKKESLLKGAVDFINKPVAFEQMQEVFKKIEQVITKEHKKVLIVEENTRHAQALAYFLETFNVATEVSNSVGKSVDALKKEGVDCVILDMDVPDQQAYETLEGLKKNAGLENLPIIIFTGRNLSKPEEQRIKQYADTIVIKTAHSYQRILDEVSLFLHLMEEHAQDQKSTRKYKRMGELSEVLSGKKILVTDDDVRNIFSLTRALEQYNMQVITAVDGKEALRMLKENPDTSAVLMDIMMPEMDGYEAMQQIRKQREFRNLPIIAVTAKAMTGDREKCIQAGASDYISKPVDIDQLLSLLRVWLYDKTI